MPPADRQTNLCWMEKKESRWDPALKGQTLSPAVQPPAPLTPAGLRLLLRTTRGWEVISRPFQC